MRALKVLVGLFTNFMFNTQTIKLSLTSCLIKNKEKVASVFCKKTSANWKGSRQKGLMQHS